MKNSRKTAAVFECATQRAGEFYCRLVAHIGYLCAFEALAHNRLAFRGHVRRVPPLFGAAYGGLCAFEEHAQNGRGVKRALCAFRIVHLLVFLLVLVGAGRAQVATEPCESRVPTANNSFSQPGNAPNGAGDGDAISWRTMPSNIWHDQKKVYWDCPRHLVRTGQWIPAAAFLGATAALIGTDQFISPHFSGTTNFHGFNNALSGTNTSLIIAAVPAATYLTGLIKKDAYAQHTALWTGEAIADSAIAVEVLKLATRRLRPEAGAPHGNFADAWLDAPTVTGGGFPSGHTVAAFSVATVMSRRYGRNHRWVPFVAYGAATAIGFSRVTLSAHNVSDVFVGATIGYVISRFVVLGRYSPN